MHSSRAAKRSRLSEGGSYRDSVPFDNNDLVNTIHVSEGRLRKVGGQMRTALPERIPHVVADAWEEVTEWEPVDDPEYALDPDGNQYDEVLEGDVMTEQPAIAKPKRKKSKVSRRPHIVWMETYRQQYLDEILRGAGRGDFRSVVDCPDCVARKVDAPKPAQYRCEECYLPDLVCGTCCVKRHRMQPFHWIQEWTGHTFSRVSLKSLGLKVQLNHGSLFCENPLPCHASMQVLHTNGIHSVDIYYCGCARAIPTHIQLLRRRLYPASQQNVKTCATFGLLGLLHRMAWTTKGSSYDFYRCLERLTNNSGVGVPKSRYRALMRMSLQWRHLAMLKWAGRGQVADGVVTTKPGELALKCPSCPHPGINLVEGWEDKPKELQFLYMMIVCMDANFRLKNQMVSNYSQDPGLGIGLAYMVPRKPYEAYVLSRANDEDISTCVGFQALAKANTKFSVGLRYTGVNAAVCGRSEMVLPLGVGNLQKGERYANMDYIFGSILQAIYVTLVLISYDIACQWFVNLWKRIENHWPTEIQPRNGIKLVPAIPKLHEPMHQTAGHEAFSLNLIHGVGHSDCECCERVWSPHNALGNSTKTQGPGSRQDVLDDHFGFWNWMKYTSIGSTLLKRFKAAVAERNLQREGHRGLSDSLSKETLKKWERLCVEWEEDGFPKSKENPYQIIDATMSEAEVKKALEAEEKAALKGGGIALHETSPSGFVTMGLEIEDMQRRLRKLAKSSEGSSTTRNEGTLKEQRNSLLVQLQAWEHLLPIYAPGLLQYKSGLRSENAATSSASDKVEETILWLPSQVPASHRAVVYIKGLPEVEERLRTAQCTDALDSIRRILRIKSRMIQFKNKNIRGQRSGTRSRAVIDRVHERARASAEKYRAARSAKLALVGPGDWEKTHRVLADSDIRGFQDPNRLRPRKARKGIREDDDGMEVEQEVEEEGEFELFNEQRTRRDGTGETRRTLSWIWTTNNQGKSIARAVEKQQAGEDKDGVAVGNSVEGENRTRLESPAEGNRAKESKGKAGGKKNVDEKKKADGDEIFRSEWARSRARVERAKEEVMMLKEEMARTLRYLAWKAKCWEGKGQLRADASMELSEGLQAYAISQAQVQQRLASRFLEIWKAPLSGEGTEEDLDSEDEDDELDRENDDGGDDEDDDDVGGDGEDGGDCIDNEDARAS